MEVAIRRFLAGDGPGVSDVMYRSIRGAATADYSTAQVEAWAPSPAPAAWFEDRARDGRVMLVAVATGGPIVGFVDLEPDGHIDLLYCAPEAVGRGVAARLFEEVEQVARQQGIEHLHVEASEAARRFFVARGFTVVARQDFELHGVAIHNYTMSRVADAGR